MNFQLKNTFIKIQCITLSNTNLVKTLVKGLIKNPKKSLSFNQNKYKQRDGRKKNLSIQSF